MIDTNPSTILLIDDDGLIRESIATYLGDSGFRVIQCADGPSGLETMARETPDVVLLDLRMPEMDGMEVLHRIKELHQDLPVIVVTGAGVLKDAIEALRMGAFDFISKPIIDMAILEHAVGKAIERTVLRRENSRYREHLEDEIRKRTHDLAQRTRELEETNARLRDEMAGRRRTESALQQSQSQVADIISVFEGFIYTMDGGFNLRYMNPKLLALSGLTRAAGICHQVVYGQPQPCPWCPLEQVLEGRTVRSEFESTRDGRWYYGIYTPQEDEQGRFDGCQAIVIDIHDRKMAEEDLRRRELLLREQNLRLRSSYKGTMRFGDIIGKSQPMHAVYRTILRAAESSANAIVYGESGTGKELVARTIHALSERGDKPFVTVNCGAIPDNLIESEFFGYRKGAFTGADRDKEGFLSAADGGTLFLDEVGEIPPSLQVKLLRAVEGGGFSPLGSSAVLKPAVRIIAATNRDLKQSVRQGRFRQDFYYRIHIIPIFLPPLRERREDIPLLIHHFLQLYGEDHMLQSIPDPTMKAMQQYHWPGNVRELQNAVQQYITLQQVDVLGHLQDTRVAEEAVSQALTDQPATGRKLDDAVRLFERRYLEQILEEHKWNRSRAAEILGINRRTLFRKIKLLGIE